MEFSEEKSLLRLLVCYRISFCSAWKYNQSQINAHLKGRSPRRLYYKDRLLEFLKSSLKITKSTLIFPMMTLRQKVKVTNKSHRKSDEGLNRVPNLLSSEGEFFCFMYLQPWIPTRISLFNFWKLANKVILFANIMSYFHGQYEVT